MRVRAGPPDAAAQAWPALHSFGVVVSAGCCAPRLRFDRSSVSRHDVCTLGWGRGRVGVRAGPPDAAAQAWPALPSFGVVVPVSLVASPSSSKSADRPVAVSHRSYLPKAFSIRVWLDEHLIFTRSLVAGQWNPSWRSSSTWAEGTLACRDSVKHTKEQRGPPVKGTVWWGSCNYVMTRSTASYYLVLRCTTLYYVVQRFKTLYYVVLRCTTVYYVVLRCVTPYHVILCCTPFYNVVLRCTTVYYVVLRPTTLYYVVQRFITLYYVVLRPTTLYYALPRYTMLYNVL